MAGVGVDEKTARVRDLLSSYYGTPTAQESPASTSASTPTARQPRSISLDAATFDAERYTSQLLKATRLGALLQRHGEMSAEIKGLDSDMQMLVYENYNKFISATDTIRSMKASMDGMDAQMRELQATIGQVTEGSGAVNAKLQERRAQMEELGAVRGLLVKVQAVFALPAALRAAVAQGAVEVAVAKYAEAAELLRAYGHKGAFRRVHAEVQACVKQLSAALKQRLASQKDEAVETIQLLGQLGEPVENLQEDYLECERQRLGAILAQAEGLAGGEGRPPRPAWGTASLPALGLPAFVVQLDQRFVSELARVAAAFSQLFAQQGRARLVQMARDAFNRYRGLVRACARRAAAEAAARAAEQLQQQAAAGEGAGGSAVDWGAADLATALSTFATDASRLQTLLPELAPRDRSLEVVEACLRHHVGQCFQQLERRIFGGLAAAARAAAAAGAPGSSAAASGQHLAEGLRGALHLAGAGLPGVLQALQAFARHAGLLKSWQDVFADLVQAQVQHTLLSLLAGLQRMAGLPTDGPEAPGGDEAGECQREAAAAAAGAPGALLLAARLAAGVEAEVVGRVLEALGAAFAGQGAAAGSDQPPAFVAGDVARRFSTGAAAMLRAHVAAEGGRLSGALAAGLAARASAAAAAADQPCSPRASFAGLLACLERAEAHAHALLSDGGGSGPSLSRGHSRPEPDGGGSELRSKRSGLQPPVFTRASVLGSVVRFALQSFVETIRLQTLDPPRLQQLQLGIHFLRSRIARFVQGPHATAAHGLLDEALAAAVERSLQETVLTQAEIESILSRSSF